MPLHDVDLAAERHRPVCGGAVLPGAQPIQHEFWRQRGVDLYDVELDDFADGLERRLLEVATT